MPDLLLELLSEEIPARMQARAAEDLKTLVTEALVEQGFLYEGAKAYATPRRLALHVVGLPAKGKDMREERRGPRIGAPEEALKGFLRSAGVASAEQVQVIKDAKKGDFYQVTIEKPGRPTPQVLSELLPGIIKSFPWPKSMRWGAASREPGSLRWVRPLHSILCTFGPEGETPEIVPLLVDGLVSGDQSRGHRFMAPAPFQARRFDDYVAALDAAKVVLDAERRREIIRHDARDLAFAQGLAVIEDEALLDEVAGLVEWPVVLMGSFEERFLDIPPEVIRATIRANQKCFVLEQALPLAGRVESRSDRGGGGAATDQPVDGEPQAPKAEGPPERDNRRDGGTPPTPDPSLRGGGEASPRVPTRLANRFVLVANIAASDGGAAIVAGNERVVRARLSDARFFWETDRKTKLEARLPKLDSIVFHEKLGTQGERVKRIAALARELAPVVGADPDLAERAARLAKADLVTEMVGEFPELQGLMGRYYAAAQGEDPKVAAAVEDHYRPLGPTDRIPTDPVTVAVALADKLDTLSGFWAIDEKPTGSKDPYALRRAALGVIRLVLENELRIRLARVPAGGAADPRADLLAFFHDRLKVYLRERGARHDLIDAVLAAGAARPPSAAHPAGEPRSTRSASFETPAAPAPQDEEVGSSQDAATSPAVIPGGPQGREGDPGTGASAAGSPSAAGASQRHAEEARNAPSRSTQAGSGPGSGDSSKIGASFETPASPGPQGDAGSGSGARHGALNDDLLMIVRRVEALGRFLGTDDGKNLLAATKRAANILRIEEKKDGRSYDDMPEVAALVAPEEKLLALALARASGAASDAVRHEDVEGAMRALAELRPAVDAFFEKVTVNAEDPALRENRLKLLSMLRRATREVADFSRIEG